MPTTADHQTNAVSRAKLADGPIAHSRVALLLIDVINDMEFEGSERLVRHANPMARRIARLKVRAAQARIPTIYVNDNFGRWRSDFRRLVEYCTTAEVPGRVVARTLRPDAHDYFVLKPMHSAFYGTTLDVLLQQLGVRTLIVTGVAGNICVLFTANDAYMRGMHVFVPEDCVASNSTRENRYALTQMETVLKAITTPSTRLSLATLKKARAGARQSRTPKR
jgi:nicotinamidase-related amidase